MESPGEIAIVKERNEKLKKKKNNLIFREQVKL